MSPSPGRRLLLAVAAAVVGLTASAAPASAGNLLDDLTSCVDQTLAQPFVPWLDPASYTLATGGAMEDRATSWSLQGGAAPANENEPYYVHAATDTTSLALPSGSRATSGAMCVGLLHPTVRLFTKRTAGSALGTLRVDVLYEDLFGILRTQTIATLSSVGTWAPSAPIPLGANLLALLASGEPAVAFRFVAQSSSWLIDDVYVDPFMRR